MTTLKAGKQAVDRRGAPRVGYTEENLAQLERMKVRDFTVGVADKRYVNKILCPDGSVIDDPDGKQMIAAAKSLSKAVLKKGDTSDPAVLRAAADAADKVKEIESHVAENRFLFIVDQDMVPVIYFQCNTPDNPDRGTWK